MAFSDLRFVFTFLPAFVLLHTLAPQKWRNPLLLLGSLGIYAFGAGWKAAALLCGVTLVHGLSALWMEGKRGLPRKLLLVLTLLLDAALLFFFKYAGVWLAGYWTGPLARVAMPLGLSFYLFQLAAYQIDVYRGDLPAERNLIDFSAFVAAFPQLVMGPILRYGDLREALRDRQPRREDLEQGFRLFVLGLGFKVVLADQLSFLWGMLERIGFAYISTPLAWLGAVGYSLQLYYDFQGYSLMAVGLGRMLALPIAHNFDQPYQARSVSDFYRRWHITLGRWFRDYLYIPLGGSRHGRARMLLSLCLVWLLTGIWHGPTLNYLLWGAVLFLFIAAEKLWLNRAFSKLRVLPHVYLLFVIIQTWVVFRVTDLRELAAYFRRLYPFFGSDAVMNRGDFLKNLSAYWWLLALGVLFCLPVPERLARRWRESPLSWIPLFALFWFCVYLLAVTGQSGSFLYFKF